MGMYCSTCGKKFDNDSQKFCPNCGALRATSAQSEETGKRPSFVQNDPKSVRASTMRRQFEERNPEPAKKRKLGFWTKLIGTALILYGLTIVFPQTRVPFERVIKNGEAVEVVAKDTFYDLAGLVGLGDSTALNVVKETPVQGSPYNLGEALSRACTSSSWRATKRDGKPAAVFTGTLKDSKDALSVVYTVEGDHCSLLSVALNGEPQTAQMLEAIVSNAVK